MRACILKNAMVLKLFHDVPQNLPKYEAFAFDLPANGEDCRELHGVQLDLEAFDNLDASPGGSTDAQNAKLVYEGLVGMTPYLARDERIWAWLTHTVGRRFTWARWVAGVADKDGRVKAVRDHFFAGGGARGIERNNALSSLWWWAHLAKQYDGVPLHESLRILLQRSDLREAIIGRPNLSASPLIFSCILRVLDEAEKSGCHHLFERNSYRDWFKKLNRASGTQFLEALPDETLLQVMRKLANLAP